MPEIIEPPADILTDICGYCGIALYPHEVSAEIAANYIDYNKRTTGKITCAFCSDCWERIQPALMNDIDSAVEKRIRLFGEGK